MRARLPNRRAHELLELEHGGIRYTLGLGRFPNGELAEIFLNAPKTGTAAAVNAQDAAIAASLLFQFGCPVEVLRRAVTRDADGRPSSALGAALDILDDKQG
jgi:hypothetical protein